MKLNQKQKENLSKLMTEIAKILFWLGTIGSFLIEKFRKWYFIMPCIILFFLVSLLSIYFLKNNGGE